MALWTPANLPGTFLWHEADPAYLTLRISQFIISRADQGNANVTAYQATDAEQPEYVMPPRATFSAAC